MLMRKLSKKEWDKIVGEKRQAVPPGQVVKTIKEQQTLEKRAFELYKQMRQEQERLTQKTRTPRSRIIKSRNLLATAS